MKTKLLVLFLILAGVSVGGIFYLKNYYFYTTTAEKVEEKQITIPQTLGLISENRENFQNYEGRAISAQRLPLIPEDEKKLEKTEKLILHFWASWCDPCVNEIPELMSYLKRHEADVKDNKLKVILVSVDYEQSAIEKFLKSFPDLNSSQYLQVWDPDGYLQKSFTIDRLPATMIIHRNAIDKITDAQGASQDKFVERFMAVVNWKTMP